MPDTTILSEREVARIERAVEKVFNVDATDIHALIQTVRALKDANKALAKDIVTVTNQTHRFRDELAAVIQERDHWRDRCLRANADLNDSQSTTRSRGRELKGE